MSAAPRRSGRSAKRRPIYSPPPPEGEWETIPASMAAPSAKETPLSSPKPRKKQANQRGAPSQWSRLKSRVSGELSKIRYCDQMIAAYDGSSAWSNANGAQSTGRRITPKGELRKAQHRRVEARSRIKSALLDASKLNTAHAALSVDATGTHHSDIFCSSCGGFDAEQLNNDILLCDGLCGRAYHAQCLEPPLSAEELAVVLAADEDEDWFCHQCDAILTCLDAVNDHEFGPRAPEPDSDAEGAGGARAEEDDEALARRLQEEELSGAASSSAASSSTSFSSSSSSSSSSAAAAAAAAGDAVLGSNARRWRTVAEIFPGVEVEVERSRAAEERVVQQRERTETKRKRRRKRARALKQKEKAKQTKESGGERASAPSSSTTSSSSSSSEEEEAAAGGGLSLQAAAAPSAAGSIFAIAANAEDEDEESDYEQRSEGEGESDDGDSGSDRASSLSSSSAGDAAAAAAGAPRRRRAKRQRVDYAALDAALAAGEGDVGGDAALARRLQQEEIDAADGDWRGSGAESGSSSGDDSLAASGGAGAEDEDAMGTTVTAAAARAE